MYDHDLNIKHAMFDGQVHLGGHLASSEHTPTRLVPVWSCAGTLYVKSCQKLPYSESSTDVSVQSYEERATCCEKLCEKASQTVCDHRDAPVSALHQNIMHA